MDALAFTLCGKTAFFKKPEVNTYAFFSYGNIHKIALMGLLGALMGYRGYSDWNQKSEQFPEFYEKLIGMQCAVIPQTDHGTFAKKMQQFNNSVGYASQEEGGNLIVREQWLEDPIWRIYLLLENEVEKQVASRILEKKAYYLPYLGKNDHPADIVETNLIQNIAVQKQFFQIHSLVLKNKITYGDCEEYEEKAESTYKYEEALPVSFDERTCMYNHQTFVLTDFPIVGYEGEVYLAEGNNIVFF